MQVQPDLELRHPPQLQHEYQWRVIGEGQALGTLVGPQKQQHGTIVLVQRSDGIHWEVGTVTQDNAVTTQDRRSLEHQQQTTSIVFYAHPALHRFPWQVPDTIANRHVLQAIKKQPYKRYRGSENEITTVLAGLQATVGTSTWQRAAMSQRPAQLWAHSNELTEYQVWVNYRLAVRQLNLIHADRPRDNCCRQLPACAKEKETLEHLFWDCPCAQACWRRLIQHWTGELWADQELGRFQPNCDSRHTPLSAIMKTSIRSSFPDEVPEYTEEWRRMWRITSSICSTNLWMQRSRTIFQQKETTDEVSVKAFWKTAMRQLTAIARREQRKPETQEKGTRLRICQAALASRPREHPPRVVSPVQPPDLSKEPALLTRLRTTQTSSR